MITGIDRATGGEVQVAGQRLNDLDKYKHGALVHGVYHHCTKTTTRRRRSMR